MTHLKPGDEAPYFKNADQHGAEWHPEDVVGHWVVLFFYPEDETPGCIKEACAFRDEYHEFKERGIKVFGISSDDHYSHSRFAERHRLPFNLLADPLRDTIQAYGVEKSWVEGGEERWGARRVTFLIDPEWRIRKVYTQIKAEEHAREVLEDIKSLTQEV